MNNFFHRHIIYLSLYKTEKLKKFFSILYFYCILLLLPCFHVILLLYVCTLSHFMFPNYYHKETATIRMFVRVYVLCHVIDKNNKEA